MHDDQNLLPQYGPISKHISIVNNHKDRFIANEASYTFVEFENFGA